MSYGSAAHRVSKISELTSLIASPLILIGRQSAVNLACACRYLEEPVLSTLWETQSSVSTLLEVFPEGNWGYEHRAFNIRMVRCRGLLLERSNAQAQGRCSSGSWEIHRQRLGSDSSVMRLGCAEFL